MLPPEFFLFDVYVEVRNRRTAVPEPHTNQILWRLGAVAELERSLIVERVKAGLRNARAKEKRLGRPRVAVEAARVARLRAAGLSWPKIARELGVSVGTVYAVARVL